MQQRLSVYGLKPGVTERAELRGLNVSPKDSELKRLRVEVNLRYRGCAGFDLLGVHLSELRSAAI